MAVSIEKRELIVSLRKTGKTIPEISSTLEVPQRTVERILHLYHKTADITPGSHSGRPRVLSQRDERELVMLSRKSPRTRPSYLKILFNEYNGKRISAQTVRRTLHRGGFIASRMRRKPALKPHQRKARLEFAKKYLEKPGEFWDHVIFSDESSFHTHETVRGRYVWRFPGEDLKDKFVQPTTKFGGCKLQVWGCLTSQGVGWACALPNGMDSETYVTILDDELKRTIQHYFTQFSGVVFQQDGAGVHRGKVVEKYLRRQKYTVLPWRAHSPDLSPIETLWADLKRRLEDKFPNIPKQDLWKVVDKEWEATSKEFCANLLHSMPKRLASVIKAHGGYTKY
jgi:transposase